VGQHKGYFPSPFVIPEQPDAGHERGAPDLFASLVTNVRNITVSPTPLFDLNFWSQSSAGAANGTSMGAALVSFIDGFFLPGVFGSALHRETLTTNGQTGRASAEQMRRQAWALKLLNAYGQRGST
jgi:hypothetical protein